MDYQVLFDNKFDDLIIEEMARTNTAGTGLGIVENGDLVFRRNYGARDFERAQSVNSDTLFCVASVTKSFICAGVLKLQEQGRLDIHDSIKEYLPITIGFDDDPITIHHLMSHQSGIPNLADAMWFRNWEKNLGISTSVPRYPFTSWEDGFRFLNGAQEFVSKPGKRFHYNNFGYGILSKLITEVANNDYKAYLRDHFFDPLNMGRTGFFGDISDQNLAKAYHDKPESENREFVHIPYEEIRLTRSLDEAAGGLFSSITELSNYMIMHLQNGEFNNNAILSPESIELMHQRHFKEKYPNAFFKGGYGLKEPGYGYGLVIDEDYYGTKLIQHSGSFIGASAWFAFLPEHNRGAIMLSNHHPSPRIFVQAILSETLGKDSKKDWPLLKLRAYQERLTGKYHTYKGLSKIRIEISAGNLVMTSEVTDPQTLIPKGNDPYTMNYYTPTEMAGKIPVQFVEEDDNLWLYIARDKWKKVADLDK